MSQFWRVIAYAYIHVILAMTIFGLEGAVRARDTATVWIVEAAIVFGLVAVINRLFLGGFLRRVLHLEST